MSFFKIFTLSALIYITNASSPGQTGGSPAAAMDYLVTLPIQVLKQLVRIDDNSKGLKELYLNSFYLSKKKLLKDEVRPMCIVM